MPMYGKNHNNIVIILKVIIFKKPALIPPMQVVLLLLLVQETQRDEAPSLGQEDPLQSEMATYPSILACRIPQTGAWLQFMGSQRVRHN